MGQDFRLALTGSPGTGKTTVAEKFGGTGLVVDSVVKLAEMHGCLGELDSEDNSRPVDLDSLCSKLSKEWFAMSDAPTVIEGHLSHHLPVDGIVLFLLLLQLLVFFYSFIDCL